MFIRYDTELVQFVATVRSLMFLFGEFNALKQVCEGVMNYLFVLRWLTVANTNYQFFLLLFKPNTKHIFFCVKKIHTNYKLKHKKDTKIDHSELYIEQPTHSSNELNGHKCQTVYVNNRYIQECLNADKLRLKNKFLSSISSKTNQRKKQQW